MRRLTLLAVPGCPLSAHGRDVLAALAGEELVSWREEPTGTPGGEELRREAPALLPAVFDESGRMLAHGRLSERALRRMLSVSP